MFVKRRLHAHALCRALSTALDGTWTVGSTTATGATWTHHVRCCCSDRYWRDGGGANRVARVAQVGPNNLFFTFLQLLGS